MTWMLFFSRLQETVKIFLGAKIGVDLQQVGLSDIVLLVLVKWAQHKALHLQRAQVIETPLQTRQVARAVALESLKVADAVEGARVPPLLRR